MSARKGRRDSLPSGVLPAPVPIIPPVVAAELCDNEAVFRRTVDEAMVLRDVSRPPPG
jgi:hypothetical protein